METEIQRGQGGDWIVKGRQRERQRDRYNRAIKTQNNGTKARSHIVQFSHFTNGETEAQVEQVTSTRSHGVNSVEPGNGRARSACSLMPQPQAGIWGRGICIGS